MEYFWRSRPTRPNPLKTKKFDPTQPNPTRESTQAMDNSVCNKRQ